MIVPLGFENSPDFIGDASWSVIGQTGLHVDVSNICPRFLVKSIVTMLVSNLSYRANL